jgi:hypothetical protein
MIVEQGRSVVDGPLAVETGVDTPELKRYVLT